ncbi:MAG: PIG-L deacetylase family protein [Eubacteriales bacterium]
MNILAIGSHPDDLEINCFGTLAKCVQRGDTVTVATVTNGCMGHMVIPPEELGPIRKGEAAEAARLIGAEYCCLDVDDLMVNRYDEAVLRQCVDLIRRTRPELVITHYFDDYARDHVETSHLVFTALLRASIPHYRTEHPYLSHGIGLYYMTPSTLNGFECTHFVDITEQMASKLAALSAHHSQIDWLRDFNGVDVLSTTRALGELYGKQSQTRYAEGFQVCKHKLKMVPRHLLP